MWKQETLKVIKKLLCCYGEHFQQPAHNRLIRQRSIDFPWTFSDGLICLISGDSETSRLKELFVNPLPIILFICFSNFTNFYMTTSDNSLTPALSYYGTKTRVKFTGSCLKQSKISYTHRKVVNIYIVYELGASGFHINDPSLKNCLFGAVTLTKNAEIDK